jgi:hypothetical protein
MNATEAVGAQDRRSDGVELTGVRCSSCGAERSVLWRTAGPATACLRCGDTHLVFMVGMTAGIGFDTQAAATLVTEPPTGWQSRWQAIERGLAALPVVHTGVVSGETMDAATRQLMSFYVLCYHLKDQLIEEASTTGVSREAVEKAVTAEPTLALVADLANLDKHGKLNKPPRSGHIPRLAELRGAQRLRLHGWQLELVIEHAGTQLDGMEVAADAVVALRRALAGWGLI